MHFPIIKLESNITAPADFATSLSYEDPCLIEHTDYYGDMYSSEERKCVINSDWLADIFDGFATIDKTAETITFLDEGTVTGNFDRYLKDLTTSLSEKASEGQLAGYDMREAATNYKGYSTLFYFDYGQTSFDFIEDAKYRAGKTYKIGNIFDAHI